MLHQPRGKRLENISGQPAVVSGRFAALVWERSFLDVPPRYVRTQGVRRLERRALHIRAPGRAPRKPARPALDQRITSFVGSATRRESRPPANWLRTCRSRVGSRPEGLAVQAPGHGAHQFQRSPLPDHGNEPPDRVQPQGEHEQDQEVRRHAGLVDIRQRLRLVRKEPHLDRPSAGAGGARTPALRQGRP